MNDFFNSLLADSPEEEERIKAILLHFPSGHFPAVCMESENASSLTFYSCSTFESHAFLFFSEMITRTLGKKCIPISLFSSCFRVAADSNCLWIVGSVKVALQGKVLPETYKEAFLEELKRGLGSPSDAARLLESRGLWRGEKENLVYLQLSSLIKRRPQDFEYDLYADMNRFLLLSSDAFKLEKSSRHLARVIVTLYLFRKALEASMDAFPERRYVSVKIFRMEGGVRLGIAIGVSFLLAHELFGVRHMQSALSACLSGFVFHNDSFTMSKESGSPVHTFYCEIDAEEGFSLEDSCELKNHLVSQFTAHIEQKLSPLFMPPNEEELLRHMLTLSHELRYVRDIPQGMIIFKEQTEDRLEFYVIVLRVVGTRSDSLMDQVTGRSMHMEFLYERSKIMGGLRSLFKEATVMRVRLKKESYLRQDHSIDLTRARQEIGRELARLIGDFRDYNGGMIAKELSLLESLKKGLGKRAQDNPFLLENFFYSISPAVMRSVLPPPPLIKLFTMLLDAEREGFSRDLEYGFQYEEDPCYAYFLLISSRPNFKEDVQHALSSLDLPPLDLAITFLKNQDHFLVGLIYHYPDPEKVLFLRFALESTLTISV